MYLCWKQITISMEPNGYRLLLPEGTLDYFILSDVKEIGMEIVIYLEEKNEVSVEYSNMQVESKGFVLLRLSRLRHNS